VAFNAAVSNRGTQSAVASACANLVAGEAVAREGGGVFLSFMDVVARGACELARSITFALLQRQIERYMGSNDGFAHSTKESTTMLLAIIRAIQSFKDYHRNLRELSQLTDRELADIGIDRADIPRVAAGHALD